MGDVQWPEVVWASKQSLGRGGDLAFVRTFGYHSGSVDPRPPGIFVFQWSEIRRPEIFLLYIDLAGSNYGYSFCVSGFEVLDFQFSTLHFQF